jgi:hypothetical protein
MFNVNKSISYSAVYLDVTLIKSMKHVVMYSTSDVYYIQISYLYNAGKVFFEKQTKTFCTGLRHWNTSRNFFLSSLKKVWRQFYIVSFVKTRYSGKGYKVYLKKLNRIFLQFGLSHKAYVNSNQSFFTFYSKSKLFFLGYNKKTLYDFIYRFIRLRYLNIFTLRGLRLSRQKMFKKVGKISAYR